MSAASISRRKPSWPCSGWTRTRATSHAAGYLIFVAIFLVVIGFSLFVVFALGSSLLKFARAASVQRLVKPVRGTPEEEAQWLQLRRDGAASAAPLSAQALDSVRRSIAGLEADDPDFDPETFLQRAEMAYLLIKRALLVGDVAPLRAYVNASLYAFTVNEVEQIKASGMRARADDLVVERVFAQSVERGPGGDRIWVHFDACARGRYVDAKSGKAVVDFGVASRFGEQCLFVRDAGVTTVTSGGVFAQTCPACGAPLALTLDARCTYCKAEVASGAHDWTLAAFVTVPYAGKTADVLLDPAGTDPTTGFAAIVAADPAFSIEAFRARVGIAFGELERARATCDLERARAFMSPGLYASWSMQAEQTRAAGNTTVIDALEVTAMEPDAVRHGKTFDDVTMRVEGKRALYVLDRTGKLFSGSKERVSFAEFWTFMRSASAKSSGAAGILEKTCPNCGAPLSVNAVGACGHCNAAVTSGTFDWVLSRITRGDEVPVAAVE